MKTIVGLRQVGKELVFSDTSYVSDIVPYTNIYKILRFIHSFDSTNSIRATATLSDQVKKAE